MSRLPQEWPTRHLFDVRIDAATTAQVVSAVNEAIIHRKRLLIGVVNAAKMVKMRKDDALRRAVLGADLILADGMSIVWACKILGTRLPERVAGIDLMEKILESCNQQARRVYLLGAAQDVLDKVQQLIRERHPGVVIVGARSGYYKPEEEETVAQEIAAAKPDVLFVGMSSPRKERFLLRWWSTMDVPVCHGVGGAFDVAAGKVKRAPRVWQQAGMEWLYRMLQEPRRMTPRYVTTNTIFAGMLLRAMAGNVRRRVFGQPSPTTTSLQRVRTSHH